MTAAVQQAPIDLQAVARKLVDARVAMILDDPFFGSLALRLTIAPDPGCKTAWVDGVTLGYDPTFIAGLGHSEIKALIAHEVMHCAAGHPWRRDARNMKRWNVACDYAINGDLTTSGYTLPTCGLMPDAQQDGKSAEWIFARLPVGQDGDDGKKDGQDGKNGSDISTAGADPDPLGEVRDAPSTAEADEEATEEAWQQAVIQAAQAAKGRGALSGTLDRFAKDAATPRVDWRAVLRRFAQDAAKSDYSWTRPNVRYLPAGMYLPALKSEEVGVLAVCVDTSGSIDAVAMSAFQAEIQAIMDEMSPRAIETIYCDASVNATQRFERHDMIQLRATGGGGTAFGPALAACDALEDRPVCAVYLTDLCGSFPAHEPSMPVLWISTHGESAPFGEVVRMMD